MRIFNAGAADIDYHRPLDFIQFLAGIGCRRFNNNMYMRDGGYPCWHARLPIPPCRGVCVQLSVVFRFSLPFYDIFLAGWLHRLKLESVNEKKRKEKELHDARLLLLPESFNGKRNATGERRLNGFLLNGHDE